jgi:hypothetical protein
VSNRNRRSASRKATLEVLESRRLLAISSAVWDVSASSFLGGSGNDDAVRGAVIQPDGTIVLAANISTATPGGLTPTLLNGATATSSGAILRLSPNGQSVLSVTRLADRVLDLANDASGNLFVAMWTQGFAKLDPTASSLAFVKTAGEIGFANVQRIDAGPTGYVAILGGGSLDSGTSLGENVQLYNPAGTLLFTNNDGKWKNDITIDETSQTVIYTGYRNAVDAASNLPVQISYFRGRDFTGAVKYTGYDWSTDPASPNYINRPTNNMADTRGYRCDVGDDGLLYVGFESAGGNFIFRYDPFNIMQPAPLAGGDAFQSAYNITSQHITFVGRYNPGTGAFLGGQELIGRLGDGTANTVRLEGGNLTADANGRVYVTGQSAWSLPLPSHQLYTHNALRPGFNPGVNNNYLGGAHLWVLEPDMINRSYVTRLTGGVARAIDVRTLGTSQQVVFGGSTSNELYRLASIQPASGGGQDGFFGVIANTSATPGNVAPVARFSYETIELGENSYTVRFDASTSSDANADPLTYRWFFGDNTTSDQPIVEKTFTNGVTYNVTLTVRDGQGGWSHQQLTLAPPVPDLKFNIGAGEAFSPVQFDASGTTSQLSTTSELIYTWDFGDGTTGSGILPSHTYTRGGVFEVKLTVADPLGSSATITRPVAIAQRGGFARRIDMNTSTSATAPGYIGFQLAVYNSSVGYGWQQVTSDYNAGSSSSTDPLFRDYHDYSKYPSGGHNDGTFLIDVPNGEYAVLIRLGHKTGHAYPAVLVEGTREATNLSVNNNGLATKVCQTVVTDGQLNVTFIRENWFVAGIEVVNIGGTQPEWAGGSFRVNGASTAAPARVGFDARGGQSGLNYAWNFGNGQTATGDRAWADYPTPGVYPVQLTVTGGSSNRIIDFGGDMVSSSVTATGVRSLAGVDLDNDGLADDTTTHVPFGVERDAPFLNGGTPKTRLFGGFANYQIDNPAGSTTFSDLSLTNSGAADYFQIRDQAGGSWIHRGLILASKADFLNGGHAQRVSFSATDTLSIRWTNWDGGTSALGRWVVRNGDTYYVSQTTFSGTGTRTLNPTAANWAPYAPSGPYGLDFDQAAATFAARTFDDVRAVGFLYERETLVSTRVWYGFDQFIVTAQLAPATYNLVIGPPVTRVSITAGSGFASEAGPTVGQLVFARTGDTTDPLTVNYTIAGTASSSDYNADVPLTGSLTIPAGVASVTINVTPVDDALVEGTETLTISLSSSLAYLPGTPSAATLTLLDNDVSIPAPTTSTATAFSPRRIDVTWNDPSSSESGFRVERSSDGGSSWTLAGTTAANVTSFLDRGLEPGTSHVYRVLTIQSSRLSAPSPTSSAATPAAVIDDRFTINSTGIWNFASYGPLGSPTEEYVVAGTNTNGLNNHDGALRSRGFHTGTSSTESALHWLGFGPMRDLSGTSFSTTGIHTPNTGANAWLAIRYGTPTGPKWAVSTQSVRTASTASDPVPGDWKLNSFSWQELDLDNLNSPGAAVSGSTVLRHALAAGVYARATGAWLANVMPIIDSFTLEAGVVVPPLTASFSTVSPNPRVNALASATLSFLRPVTGLTADHLSLTLNGVPIPITGVSLSTSDQQTWTIGGLASFTAAKGNYVLSLSGAGIMDDGGLLLSNAPELSWGKYVLGDVNDDGQVNNQDIAPFVLALTNPQDFAQQYPQVPMPLVGDVNGDGVFNNQDIAPFVALLTGGKTAPRVAPPLKSATLTTRIATSVFEPTVDRVATGVFADRRLDA